MKSRIATISFAAVLLLLVARLDYVTGPELGFFIFYYLPISVAAWHLGRRAGILFVFAALCAWLTVETANGLVYSSDFVKYWNGGIRLVAFLIIALVLPRIRASIVREQALSEGLSRALSEVKRLSGLLPICANCKKIRDGEGDWHHVESYVRARSEAEFSHTICAPCAEKLYPEFPLKKSNDRRAIQSSP